MSRKKVKKEVVKRKTNIYDPMGVYGRGLTENQRLGMTRQMKIENMAIPKPVITRELLKEYEKILKFYDMYPEKPTGKNITVKILEASIQGHIMTITNQDVLNYLESVRITPGVFYCDSFAIVKDQGIDEWYTDMSYQIEVGNSVYGPNSIESETPAPYSNNVVKIPAYWMDNGIINCFAIKFDSTERAGDTELWHEDLNDRQTCLDFVEFLPNHTVVPYLLYPNDNMPEFKLSIINIPPYNPSGYKLQVRLVVMY